MVHCNKMDNQKSQSNCEFSGFLQNDSSGFSSDDDCEQTLPKTKSSSNVVVQTINKVVDVQIQNKLSHQATCSVVKLLNSHNNDIKLPENKSAIKAYAYDENDYKFFVKCLDCDEMIEHDTKCIKCQRLMKIDSKKNNFLVYFQLEHQIRRILERHLETIISYLNRDHVNDTLADVDDGILFKRLRNETPQSLHIVALTLNVDGANIFKSSRDSLWPVQLVLNCLPPAIRYFPENIIISTLHYSREQPCMTDLLYLLAVEMDHLNKQLITVYKDHEFHNFVPKLLLCACDLPARTKVQNFKGTNAKFGCPFCFHPGIPTANNRGRTTIRFTKHEATSKLRTHSATIKQAQKVVMTNRNKNGEDGSIHGIKGQSAILLFDDVDVIESFSIDVMHGAALGITKDLVEIWLGLKTIPAPPYQHYKIKNKRQREILENRINSLRPTSVFKRSPRSIFEIRHFKASELFNLLWYYLRYSIVGLLPTRIVKHFELFSAATLILCQKTIKMTEIQRACDMLKKFADDFEGIYGCGAVGMNLHLLNHYHRMILNCGPLWSYNLFAFENNIGVLKKFVTGNTDVLCQIAMKYARSRANENIDSMHERSNQIEACGSISIILDQEHVDIFERDGHTLDSGAMKVWQKIKMNQIIYTSQQYKQTKSADFFVEVENGQIGIIQYFFGEKFQPKFLLNVFDKIHANHHWTEVKPTNSLEIYSCKEIKQKLLYLKSVGIQYTTTEPNMYGAFCF